MFITLACSSEEEEKGTPVASVNDAILYKADIHKMIDPAISESEKKQLKQTIIDQWIEQQLLISEIKEYNTRVSPRTREKLAAYKTSLLKFELEKQLIGKVLDTLVIDDEITEYYTRHIDDFKLEDYLVQAIFIKTTTEARMLDKVNRWFRVSDTTEWEKLKDWGSEQAQQFYFEHKSWIKYDEIEKMLPPDMVYNKKYFIINKLARKYETNNDVYFFRILDYRTGFSPIEYEKENIRTRIIQMRITDLRKNLLNNVLKDARENNEIKRY